MDKWRASSNDPGNDARLEKAPREQGLGGGADSVLGLGTGIKRSYGSNRAGVALFRNLKAKGRPEAAPRLLDCAPVTPAAAIPPAARATPAFPRSLAPLGACLTQAIAPAATPIGRGGEKAFSDLSS